MKRLRGAKAFRLPGLSRREREPEPPTAVNYLSQSSLAFPLPKLAQDWASSGQYHSPGAAPASMSSVGGTRWAAEADSNISSSISRDFLEPDSGFRSLLETKEPGLRGGLEVAQPGGWIQIPPQLQSPVDHTCPEVDDEGFTVRPDVTQNNILLAAPGGSCWHSKDANHSTFSNLFCTSWRESPLDSDFDDEEPRKFYVHIKPAPARAPACSSEAAAAQLRATAGSLILPPGPGVRHGKGAPGGAGEAGWMPSYVMLPPLSTGHHETPFFTCAEKLQSEEQVSKNLFGPPLESAFDHEDFTGDGDKGLEDMGVARGKMGGATAKSGRSRPSAGGQARLEGRLAPVRVGGAGVEVGGAIERAGPWAVGSDWVDGPPGIFGEGSHQKAWPRGLAQGLNGGPSDLSLTLL
ncbi:hypothetical protein P7K49_033596 [Saguinus oedipus]|uniref:Uncharacterized protein n=1 Tax=Saguinus oedipus TaxID=9490 RepID=A0ABQ9TSD5_SAGOE|nr:hypothetical protein P7K49_033596 [Saguinus oedipus]